ncbi:hypothetical protein BDR26DRAFT_865908 [Obelidium mucronatum]|nr:hypothetical protein BDR26DRAFT_865908 [Obelidium mucronatum]
MNHLTEVARHIKNCELLIRTMRVKITQLEAEKKGWNARLEHLETENATLTSHNSSLTQRVDDSNSHILALSATQIALRAELESLKGTSETSGGIRRVVLEELDVAVKHLQRLNRLNEVSFIDSLMSDAEHASENCEVVGPELTSGSPKGKALEKPMILKVKRSINRPGSAGNPGLSHRPLPRKPVHRNTTPPSTIIPPTKNPFECKNCSSTFKTRNTFESHIQDFHGNYYKIMYPSRQECLEIFRSEDETLYCPCGSIFYDAHSLREHAQACIGEYSAGHCDAAATISTSTAPALTSGSVSSSASTAAMSSPPHVTETSLQNLIPIAVEDNRPVAKESSQETSPGTTVETTVVGLELFDIGTSSVHSKLPEGEKEAAVIPKLEQIGDTPEAMENPTAEDSDIADIMDFKIEGVNAEELILRIMPDYVSLALEEKEAIGTGVDLLLKAVLDKGLELCVIKSEESMTAARYLIPTDVVDYFTIWCEQELPRCFPHLFDTCKE